MTFKELFFGAVDKIEDMEIKPFGERFAVKQKHQIVFIIAFDEQGGIAGIENYAGDGSFQFCRVMRGIYSRLTD